jgi:hypothetical protein
VNEYDAMTLPPVETLFEMSLPVLKVPKVSE